jgi:hypothetical protein
MALYDEETKVRQICHDRGLQAINEERKKRDQKISQSRLKTQGMNSLVGLENIRERLKRVALEAKNDCLEKDEMIKRRMESIKRVHQLNVQRLNMQLERLEKLQQEKFAALVNEESNPELKKRLREARQKHAAEKKKLESAHKSSQTKVKAMDAQLKRLQTELAKEDAALKSFIQQERIAKSAGATKSKNDVDPNELIDTAGDYQTTLNAAVSACCGPSGAKVDAAKMVDAALCQRLKDRQNAEANARQEGAKNPTAPGRQNQ